MGSELRILAPLYSFQTTPAADASIGSGSTTKRMDSHSVVTLWRPQGENRWPRPDENAVKGPGAPCASDGPKAFQTAHRSMVRDHSALVIIHFFFARGHWCHGPGQMIDQRVRSYNAL